MDLLPYLVKVAFIKIYLVISYLCPFYFMINVLLESLEYFVSCNMMEIINIFYTDDQLRSSYEEAFKQYLRMIMGLVFKCRPLTMADVSLATKQEILQHCYTEFHEVEEARLNTIFRSILLSWRKKSDDSRMKEYLKWFQYSRILDYRILTYIRYIGRAESVRQNRRVHVVNNNNFHNEDNWHIFEMYDNNELDFLNEGYGFVNR